MKHKNSERGQAIVLIVFAIFALLGMAALAIDIGQLFAARRNAQNAADSAALAAAYEMSAGSHDKDTAVAVAFGMTQKNGFSNDGETNWVVVNNPPVDSPYCYECEGIVDANNYFQVLVTVRMNPIFSQFIFSGLKEVKVEAVAHSTQADTMSAGNALMALDETSDSAMIYDGNNKVRITGGNMRSNGGITTNGNSARLNVDSLTGGVWYASPSSAPRLSIFTDAKPQLQSPVRIGSVKPPACPTAAEAASWSSEDGVKYKEYTYDAKTFRTYYHGSGLKGNVDLPPGIHCIDGGIDKGNYTGYGVLIVLLSGDVKQTGGDSFHFETAGDLRDMNGVQWSGMVFFIPRSNTAEIKLGGNSGGYFWGTVYAPAATCNVGGTPDESAINAAIICYHVKIHGTPTLNISYKPEEQFHFPPVVELVQ